MYQSLWGTWGISKDRLRLPYHTKSYVWSSLPKFLESSVHLLLSSITWCFGWHYGLMGTLRAPCAQAEPWMTKLLGDNYILYFRHCGLQYCFILSCLFVSSVTPGSGQRLLLALNSGIIPGRIQDHTRCWGSNPDWPNARQVKHLKHCSITLVLLCTVNFLHKSFHPCLPPSTIVPVCTPLLPRIRLIIIILTVWYDVLRQIGLFCGCNYSKGRVSFQILGFHTGDFLNIKTTPLSSILQIL